MPIRTRSFGAGARPHSGDAVVYRRRGPETHGDWLAGVTVRLELGIESARFRILYRVSSSGMAIRITQEREDVSVGVYERR